MPRQDDRFADLLHRIRGGSEEAMLELVEKYGQAVFRVVRRRLNRAMRSKFDSADFVQAVWASFFEIGDRLFEFKTAKDLVAFLVQIAHNKVIDEVRRRMTSQARNVTREEPLEESEAGESVVSPSPSASQIFIADEQFRRLTAERSVRSRLVVELKRNGASHVEIAAILGVTPRTVQRVLERLQRKVVS
jgi:RNA polymerase sigma factor (sigma-70 family)